MLIDVTARQPATNGSYDVRGYSYVRKTVIARLRPRAGGLGAHDVQGFPASLLVVEPAVGGFPTQYLGLRIQGTLDAIDICLVAEADAPTGMGGVWKIKRTDGTYAVYLVETSDGNASPLRIRTTTGTKSARLKI